MDKWMRKYLIRTDDIANDDVIILHGMIHISNVYVLSFYAGHNIGCWSFGSGYMGLEPLDKLVSLFDTYFGFKTDISHSHRYVYYKMGLCKGYFDKISKFGRVLEQDNKNFIEVEISRPKQFIKQFNALIIEYLTWCKENRKTSRFLKDALPYENSFYRSTKRCVKEESIEAEKQRIVYEAEEKTIIDQIKKEMKLFDKYISEYTSSYFYDDGDYVFNHRFKFLNKYSVSFQTCNDRICFDYASVMYTRERQLCYSIDGKEQVDRSWVTVKLLECFNEETFTKFILELDSNIESVYCNKKVVGHGFAADCYGYLMKRKYYLHDNRFTFSNNPYYVRINNGNVELSDSYEALLTKLYKR